MRLDVRSGSQSLSFDRRPDGVHAGDAPLEAQLTPLGGSSYVLMAGGRPRVVTIERDGTGRDLRVTVGGTAIPVTVRTGTDLLLERFGMDTADTSAAREVRAPMPGLVLRVLVAPGDAIVKGQGVIVLEAMKMENELASPADGVVAAVRATAGAAVAKNDLLVELAAE